VGAESAAAAAAASSLCFFAYAAFSSAAFIAGLTGTEVDTADGFAVAAEMTGDFVVGATDLYFSCSITACTAVARSCPPVVELPELSIPVSP
jgi:hypothetical protein